MVKAKDKPACIADVTKAFAAVQRNIKELVKLLGDPDDAVSNEACSALIAVGPLAADPLAAAILRPMTPVHRIKAIFVVKEIRPKKALNVQKALHRVAKCDKHEQIGATASILLSELLDDEMEDAAMAVYRKRRTPALHGLLPSCSRKEPDVAFISERLSALDSEE
jgi:hypothetical protein